MTAPTTGERDYNEYGIEPTPLMNRPQDFPEDAAHENGNYSCICHRCNHVFVGLKRRVTCKLCVTIDALRADLARVTAERDALLNNQELIQARIATYERALVQYANSINWMTHTDDAADDIRRVWVGSDDGRNYAREALEDGTAYEMNSDMDFYEIHPPHSRDGIV